jgi:hypothetical protein
MSERRDGLRERKPVERPDRPEVNKQPEELEVGRPTGLPEEADQVKSEERGKYHQFMAEHELYLRKAREAREKALALLPRETSPQPSFENIRGEVIITRGGRTRKAKPLLIGYSDGEAKVIEPKEME